LTRARGFVDVPLMRPRGKAKGMLEALRQTYITNMDVGGQQVGEVEQLPLPSRPVRHTSADRCPPAPRKRQERPFVSRPPFQPLARPVPNMVSPRRYPQPTSHQHNPHAERYRQPMSGLHIDLAQRSVSAPMAGSAHTGGDRMPRHAGVPLVDQQSGMQGQAVIDAERRRAFDGHAGIQRQAVLDAQRRAAFEGHAQPRQAVTHAGMQQTFSQQQRAAAIPSQPRAPTGQVRQPPPVVRHSAVRQPVEAMSPSPQVPSKDRSLYVESPRVSRVQLTQESRDRARAEEKESREPALALQEVEDDLSCPM
jgi:hypothetical protein